LTNGITSFPAESGKCWVWLRQGKSNKDIARELNISQKTVKTHAQSIYAKLEVNSRAEAIVKTQGWNCQPNFKSEQFKPEK
jgi:DNA-binding CsgD family transcriptional regulator